MMNSQDFTGIFPASVKGVGIVSASHLIAPEKLALGTDLLTKAGYRVKTMPNVLKMEPPEVKARLFEEAWLDPEIDFLLFSTGGLGAADVIGLIDWERLRARDMRVIGYSDVTLILGAMLAKGVGRPISGPMLSRLVTDCSPEAFEWLRQMLDGAPLKLRLVPVKPCAAPVAGKSVAGLINRFPVLLDKGFPLSFDGRVVFLENTPKYADIAETVLDDLTGRGVFEKAAAVVFCDFNRDWERSRVDALFDRFATKVPCPVFSGYPYGHVRDSFAIDFTRPLRISAAGDLEWPSMAVSNNA